MIQSKLLIGAAVALGLAAFAYRINVVLGALGLIVALVLAACSSFSSSTRDRARTAKPDQAPLTGSAESDRGTELADTNLAKAPEPAEPDAPAKDAAGGTCPLKHVFFDFDQTISRIHVFKQLAGWEPGVEAPCAQSERGQISRVRELNAEGNWSYDEGAGEVVHVQEGDSWSCCALGGPARVQEFRKLCDQLQNAGVRLTIITKGYVGVVQYILAEEGLRDFFEAVYGLLGNAYGETEYDAQHRDPSPYEGSQATRLQSNKAYLINALMEQEQIEESEAVLVEDDVAEVQSVRGLCRGVFVAARQGVGEAEMRELREMAGLV
mmetsp:Transcript_120197/g.220001  ORF Transcript_120197/g.220001 Transcript_120197/m.220001 type:complete len:323 (+) Transcript_120197:76-1044(+)